MATLGQKLKAAREAKGITESEAGAAIKTLTRVIVAMEADDFSGMAAPTYAKGFIRLYARHLGLNPDPLIEEYTLRHAPGPKPLIKEDAQPEQSSRPQLVAAVRKRIPVKFNPPAWLRVPALSKGLKPYVVKDIRALAVGVASLLVLIVLAVSATNLVRRHAANKPAPQPEASARMLLDKKLPDLYLVEPGKIEQK